MKVYSHTDIGNRRSENQDSFISAVLEDAVFGAVCDGMGGSNAGKEASTQAADVIREYVTRGYRTGLDELGIRNLLAGAVVTANAVVYELGSSVPRWKGMGTTCVCALVRDNTLFAVNVGDSRCYLIDNGIRQISRDHSMVMRLYENGDITREELRHHPKRNIITRAVGADKNVMPDYFEREISAGASVLLCSDGLSGFCEEEEMEQIIRTLEPDKAVRALVQKALDNESTDNITAVLITS